MPSIDSAAAVIAIRIAIALVFLFAAIGKARHLAIFGGVVANYRLLPPALVLPVAYILPPAEAAIGLALLTGRMTPWAEAAAAFLLGSFAVAIGINLLRGRRHIDCGCFQGTLKQTLRWSLVVRNAVMVVLLVGAAIAAPAGRVDAWTLLNGILAGGALFIIVQAFNALWTIVPVLRRPVDRQPHAHTEGAL